MRVIGMAAARYKFRLGDQQHIMLRCDAVSIGDLQCRARARLGTIEWTAHMDVSEAEMASFLLAVERVVATSAGRAELKPDKTGAFILAVSVDARGAVKTEYEAWGWDGGQFGTQWHVSGAYVCSHQHYLTRLDQRETPAG